MSSLDAAGRKRRRQLYRDDIGRLFALIFRAWRDGFPKDR
jgi:hypothetical protein